MAATNESFEIREKVSKAAAKATQDACAKLHYECVFVGEIACFAYGGRRPPMFIEAIAIPKNQSENKTSIGVLKRLIATQTIDVDGRFDVTPLNVNLTVLSFEHNQYVGQGKDMVIRITIASDTDALDVQPLETIDGLQYARPEYILAHRLELWIEAHTIKPEERSQKIRTMHRNREIDPLLRHLAKMRKKITNWNEFDPQHIIQYCTAYQPSATKLWAQVGFDSKLVNPSESKPVASSSSTPNPPPAAASSSASKPVAPSASKPVAPSASKPVAPSASKPVASSSLKPVATSALKPIASSSSTPTPPPAAPPATPSVAPPPYQVDAATPTPLRTPSLSGASTPKLQQQTAPLAPAPAPALPAPAPPAPPAPPLSSNTHQTAPSTSKTEAEILWSTPRIKMIHLAAQRTTELLRAMFIPSAIFGTLACFMYGNRRSPNDVDILVLPPSDCDLKVEEVKMLIVVKDPEHFFVVSANDPNADYNILYYRLAQTGAGDNPLTSCKVNLVYPGTLELPRVPPSMIKWSEGLPLIPFSVLLLQTLQSWDYHGQAAEKLKVMKQKTDVEDLRGMFDLDMMEELRNSSPWTDDTLFTWTFLQDSLSRAQEFCDAHPDTLECWRHIGFML